MIQRGNNRSACFFAREDYSYYLENLAELAGKHNCAVHAYCLMTNHVHLLLTPGDYPWSSYRANAQGEDNPVLTPHELFLRLGASAEERFASYRELFRNELAPGQVDQIRQATNGNFALGNQRFIAEAEATLGRRVAKGTPGRPAIYITSDPKLCPH